MSTTQNIDGLNKPKSIRAIFILNALKIVLALSFLMFFTFADITVGAVGPSIILYTLIGYVVFFTGMVVSILKRSQLGLQISIVLDFITSIPSTAIIGFVIAIVSMILTFSKSSKAYFHYSPSPAV